ncbi:hypothetical protein RHMOL_Rhmol12G0224100 [Rhododendron molle]|uniref:Uncharacterized protein n=1 Tax=Rhododendron molle TaxID=49168 RepID=A0ACC0LLM1_RHOML|nr:hypothetical protein RHMOL_Rhmol12G0224100 [Rhododendron molle]
MWRVPGALRDVGSVPSFLCSYYLVSDSYVPAGWVLLLGFQTLLCCPSAGCASALGFEGLLRCASGWLPVVGVGCALNPFLFSVFGVARYTSTLVIFCAAAL